MWHELDNELGRDKLYDVNFQGVPADEIQSSGYGCRWLEATRAAYEKTKTNEQNANAEHDDGELGLREKRIPFVPAKRKRPLRQSQSAGASIPG